MSTISVLTLLLACILLIIFIRTKTNMCLSLFILGLLLVSISICFHMPAKLPKFSATGFFVFDALQVFLEQMVTTFKSCGFALLAMGAYSWLMDTVGATDMALYVLGKPFKNIRSRYFVLPCVFLLISVCILVLPSSSSLALLFMASVYPLLRSLGFSQQSAAAVMCVVAIFPTPLATDSLALLDSLHATQEFAQLSVYDLVWRYQVIVDIPVLIVIAVVHYFWQKHMDKVSGYTLASSSSESSSLQLVQKPDNTPLYYACFPFLPLVFALGCFALSKCCNTQALDVFSLILLSIITVVTLHTITRKFSKKSLVEISFDELIQSFSRMISVCLLLVSAQYFALGLQSIGLLTILIDAMQPFASSGMGYIFVIILVLLEIAFVYVSGSGVAFFMSMTTLIPAFAALAHVSILQLAIPLGLAGHLARCLSPVSPMMIIVAKESGLSARELIKRQIVPITTGLITALILSYIFL